MKKFYSNIYSLKEMKPNILYIRKYNKNKKGNSIKEKKYA